MAGHESRPHVVIENRDDVAAAAQAAALDAAGFRTSRCAGPDHEVRDCPVLTGEPCDLIAEADVVLHDLDLDHPVDREVLARLQRDRPGLPIVVEAGTTVIRQDRRELLRCTVVTPYSMEHLAAAVAEALSTTV